MGAELLWTAESAVGQNTRQQQETLQHRGKASSCITGAITEPDRMEVWNFWKATDLPDDHEE